MMKKSQPFNFFEDSTPDITLGGLCIWFEDNPILDAEFTFLTVIAICRSNNAEVRTTGKIMVLEDISQWLKNCEPLYTNLTGSAECGTLDEQIGIELKMDKSGGMTVTVFISPDLRTQKHSFIFELDQTHLLRFINECRSVFARYNAISTKSGEII